MKLQNFIIIFIIIILPIVLIFSLYLNLETKTITIQTDYDEKLIEATKEAVEAFEINTTEWNSKYSSLANLKRQDLMSSINVFTTSLSNKLGISGSSKENILSYVPAVVYIMYDGYYIYAPTHVPETITNSNGVQLFYYKYSGSRETKITASATQNLSGTIVAGEPMYVRESGPAITETYNGTPITFTTEISDAKKTYKHVLKTFVPYTTTSGDYVINYTLDNYIRVYGEVQSKEGYVLNPGDDIRVQKNFRDGVKVIFNREEIVPETLTEYIYIKNNKDEDAQLIEYPYIYNSNNDKRYYDESAHKFFMLNKDNVKVYLPETEVGETLAEYKKLLVRTENANFEYIELYQLLNSNSNDTNWYYKDAEDEYSPYDNHLITGIDREEDCSAINYYVESLDFKLWLNNKGIDTDNLLSKKRETIINNINNNFNLSISNYNANTRMDYKIFELTDEDWDQALSNISMITFFQGIKTGLKTYNNYAIVTSTENNEYVSEDSLYYIGGNGDQYYHRYCCNKGTANTYQAYRNTDFKVQNYKEDDEIKYYYKHEDVSGEEIYECFDCIVNRNNYETSSDNYYDKTFYIALGRERYIQMSKINLTINLNKTMTVTFDTNATEEISISPTSKLVTIGIAYGELPTPTRDGYTFAGWYTSPSGGSQVTSSTIVNKTQDHTLYAHWSADTYTVTFDANGGVCNTLSKQVIRGNTYGTLPEPIRMGYTFAGWYTQASGGTHVTGATTVPDIGNHTLYAHWTVNTYTVTFNANGGSVSPTSKNVTVGSTYGTLPTPTKEGYTFAGWYTQASGGNHVTGATTVPDIGNHILYAHWTVNTYTVTFNANGGSVSTTSKNVTAGSTYGTLPTPTRTGHTFNGWYTSATGGNKVTSSTQVTATQNHTLYAHWTINIYTISYNANSGSGAPSSQTKTYGVDLTLSSKAPTRTNYIFLGWSTSSTATTATYAAGGKYTSNSSATLYAVWKLATVNVTSVTLNQTSDQWIPLKNNGSAGTLSLTATVAPSNATNKTVTWTSSNNSVATVSNGKVTAKGAGLATITATAGGKSASVKVYVYNIELRYREDWAEPVLKVTTYKNETCTTQGGTLKSKKGGTKLIINQSGTYLKILYKSNYDANGTLGDYIKYKKLSSLPTGTFKNYGAY